MPVPAPSDKRFRRARVRPTRRRPARSRWRGLIRTAGLLALVLASLYSAAQAALSAEVLTVTHISVSGDSRTARGEVLALLDGLQGSHMMTVKLEEWRRALLGSPWVADASLRRTLPGTISVAIVERQPMGIARIGEGLYLVDGRGAIIDEYGPTHADFDLPVIDGLTAGAPGGRVLVDEARAALVSRLMTQLQERPNLARRVSQIDVTDVRDAAVILSGDTALVRLGDGDFVERLQSYVDLAPALRERVPDIDAVDLRFGDRVYVRPGSLAEPGARPSAGSTPSGGRSQSARGSR